jgi:hypothetical protein
MTIKGFKPAAAPLSRRPSLEKLSSVEGGALRRAAPIAVGAPPLRGRSTVLRAH